MGDIQPKWTFDLPFTFSSPTESTVDAYNLIVARGFASASIASIARKTCNACQVEHHDLVICLIAEEQIARSVVECHSMRGYPWRGERYPHRADIYAHESGNGAKRRGHRLVRLEELADSDRQDADAVLNAD